MEEIKQLCLNKEEKKLHELMQSTTWQAFYDLDYGGLPGGVFTAACPPEALHSLENGLVLHCLNQLFDYIVTNTVKVRLDDIVQKWTLYLKQFHMESYMAAYP